MRAKASGETRCHRSRKALACPGRGPSVGLVARTRGARSGCWIFQGPVKPPASSGKQGAGFSPGKLELLQITPKDVTVGWAAYVSALDLPRIELFRGVSPP